MAANRLASFAVVSALALSAFGCSSVGSTAIRTGPAREPPHAGPVAVFAAGLQPVGQDLGVVEVHGTNQDGAIDDLLPVVVARVAQLGGDAAVIDDVRAQFHSLPTLTTQTYTYPCGYRSICVGTRVYPVADEVMTVVVRARAMKMAPPGTLPPPPAGAPPGPPPAAPPPEVKP